MQLRGLLPARLHLADFLQIAYNSIRNLYVDGEKWMKLRTVSTVDPDNKRWFFIVIVIWLAMSAWEIYSWMTKGSLIGIAYIPFFLGLIIWRCAFKYEIIVEEGRILAQMSGFGYYKAWQATTAEIRMLMPLRKRMLLRELGVSDFSHQYSSLDSNQMRVLLVQRQGKKNPHALLFKADDEFYEKLARELQRQNPEIR